jgi:hypothetical protein
MISNGQAISRASSVPLPISGNPPAAATVAVSTAATPNLVPLNGLVVFDADYVRIVDHVAQLPQRGREFPKPGALLITLS